jgi:integrase
MSEEAGAWVKGLITPERSAATVKKTWLNASKTVFQWALEQKHISRNPFIGIKVTVPKRKQLRETRAFHADEASTILIASVKITETRTAHEACKRWVPWLCAYTGARPGEMTQLRGADVIERDGVHAIRITPAAGTVKGGTARTVPLHEHLIAQGFLEFVHGRGRGPLFFNPVASINNPDPTKQKKPRAAQARQRLATWVRALGVSDPHITLGGTRSSKGLTALASPNACRTTSRDTPTRAKALATAHQQLMTWRQRSRGSRDMPSKLHEITNGGTSTS